MEAKEWLEERLKVLVAQAIALRAHGEEETALQALNEALALAEPGGITRLFVDEGPAMARLLSEAATRGIAPDYVARLRAAFPDIVPSLPQSKTQNPKPVVSKVNPSKIIDPLTERETEVLRLIADGLTNREIATKLCLSFNTIKVHTRNIYSKLDAHHRADAVARARTLGILHSN